MSKVHNPFWSWPKHVRCAKPLKRARWLVNFIPGVQSFAGVIFIGFWKDSSVGGTYHVTMRSPKIRVFKEPRKYGPRIDIVR